MGRHSNTTNNHTLRCFHARASKKEALKAPSANNALAATAN